MGAQEHRFAAVLHGEPGVWTAASGDRQPSSAAYGIALLSRFPVRSWDVLDLPLRRRRAPVRWPGSRWPTLVRDEPRAALVASVQTPGGDLSVVATHLTFIPGHTVRQLTHLGKSIRRLPPPVVLLGDLNLGVDRAREVSGLDPLATALTFPVADPTQQ